MAWSGPVRPRLSLRGSRIIRCHDGKGPELEKGVRFYFETFGFPVAAQFTEYAPAGGARQHCPVRLYTHAMHVDNVDNIRDMADNINKWSPP